MYFGINSWVHKPNFTLDLYSTLEVSPLGFV